MAGILDFLIDNNNANARTPSFLPSRDDGSVSVPGSDPLEDELIQLLRKRRQPNLGGRIGNVIRGGVAAAAQPNRAFGGPMDALAAFSGGLNNARVLDLQDEQLYNRRQDRDVDMLGEIINNQRRGQVAQSQIEANRARAMAAEAAMARANKEKNTVVTGTGTVLERDANGKLVPVFTPSTKPVEPTEEEKNAARSRQIVDYAKVLVEEGNYDLETAMDTALALFGRTPLKRKKDKPTVKTVGTPTTGVGALTTNLDGTITYKEVAPPKPRPGGSGKVIKPNIRTGANGEVIEITGAPGSADVRVVRPGTPKKTGGKLAEIAAKLGDGSAATGKVKLKAPDGTIREVPAADAEYYIQRGAVRIP